MVDSKILVLIPHFNNPKGLAIAINSIQEDFKITVLVVDDGSKEDKIEETLLKNEASSNVDIVIECLPNNKGIEHALNYGLEYFLQNEFQFLARLDCGDVCLPQRFFKQQKFLYDQPSIDLVGSNVSFFRQNGDTLFTLKLPSTDKEIRNKMYINAMIIHPTFFMRREVVENIKQYPTQYEAAEDYAFLFLVLKKHKVANLTEILVKCELSPIGISALKRKKQLKNRVTLIKKHFHWGMYPIYGLMRNYIILWTPEPLFEWVKMKTKNKKISD